jgi:integrase/recombinase XerD
MIKLNIEFCDEVKEFLNMKKKSTAKVYKAGLKLFISFYKDRYGQNKTFSEFLDILEENSQLPRNKRRKLAETELVEFIKHLEKLNYSRNSIRAYIAGVQNFLKYKDFTVSQRWLGNLPRSIPMKKNRKHKWKLSQIKEFVDKAQTYRDKAIILVLFQSGISISDLCEFTYGDVKKQIEEGGLPVLLNLARRKTGVSYKTFIGADAVQYLKQYLKTRRNITDNKPLFTKWNSNITPLTPAAITKKFKEITPSLSFIQDNGGINPARPHSLRSAFRSRLTGKMDGDLIEFFMGHEIGEVKRAYINLPDDEFRDLYTSFEKELSIERTSRDIIAEREGNNRVFDEKSSKRVSELEVTIKTLSQTLNNQSKLFDYQMGENERLSGKLVKLSQEMNSIIEFLSIVKEDPGLLEPYSEEQLAWLRNKTHR